MPNDQEAARRLTLLKLLGKIEGERQGEMVLAATKSAFKREHAYGNVTSGGEMLAYLNAMNAARAEAMGQPASS